MNNKSAFSLIEVMVAASILSIAVFGVFKLISENTKIVYQSQNNIQANFLVSTVKECLDLLYKQNDFAYMSTTLISPVYVNLGGFATTCTIGDDTTINTLDNINYQLYAKRNNLGFDYIDWEIYVSSETTQTISYNYIQK